MELRVLASFLEVARCKNMSKAAHSLYLSQPTLSKQMKALEEELGRPLFKRKSSGMELTEQGERLEVYAREIFDLIDKIKKEFDVAGKSDEGHLYFGLAESRQISLLAKEIKAFKEKRPRLHHYLFSGDRAQVLQKLDRGLLDFAVVINKPNPKKYKTLALPAKDTWGLIMPAKDPLADKEALTFEDIKDLPLLCSQQAWNAEIREWTGHRNEEMNLAGTYVLPYNASLFVKEGLGYQLTLDHLVDTSRENGLLFRPLKPKLQVPLYLVWKKEANFSDCARDFLAHIKQSLESISESETSRQQEKEDQAD